jgi:hypothetical protein
MVALTKEEIAFLDALCGTGRGHVSERHLKELLAAEGFTDESFASVKRRLLFAGYVGSIYGNLTLEKRDYRGVAAEPSTF